MNARLLREAPGIDHQTAAFGSKWCVPAIDRAKPASGCCNVSASRSSNVVQTVVSASRAFFDGCGNASFLALLLFPLPPSPATFARQQRCNVRRRFQRRPATKIADPAGDRIAAAGGHVLTQIGRAILVGLVVVLLPGQRGLLEVVGDRDETCRGPIRRRRCGAGRRTKGWTCPASGRTSRSGVWSRLMALLERFGQPEKRFRPAGVQRQAADRLDGRAVDAFPLNPALVAGGKPAVVERAMQRAGETQRDRGFAAARASVRIAAGRRPWDAAPDVFRRSASPRRR